MTRGAELGFFEDVYRMLRYGPALYRAARRLGSTRSYALKLVIWP